MNDTPVVVKKVTRTRKTAVSSEAASAPASSLLKNLWKKQQANSKTLR